MIQVETRTIKDTEQRTLLLSWETALYVVSVALAAALRLWGLGAWPLLLSEARQAWDAWQLVQGAVPTALDYSPLLMALNAADIFLFGAGDAVVRAWPALAGTLLALMPFFLRERLGRVGALVASFLLATSPAFLYFSRTLDGAVIASLAAMVLILAFDRLHRTRSPRYLLLGAAGLAMGLMSSPIYWTFDFGTVLVAVLVFWEGSRGKSDEAADLRDAWAVVSEDAGAVWRAVGMLVGLLLLVGSIMLLNVGGWQATLNVLGRWLGAFGAGGGNPWYATLQRLAAYELLALLAGIAGFVLAIRRRDWFSRLLVVWTAFAVIVHCIGGQRSPEALLAVGLPLILLAARAIDALVDRIVEIEVDPYSWIFVGVALLLFSYIYFQMVAFTFDGKTAYETLAIVAGVGLLVCYGVFWYWVGTPQALAVGAMSLLALLLLFQVHTTMELNVHHARDPREAINVAPTSTDVLNVAPFVRDLSSRYAGNWRVVPVLVEAELEPVIGWYLRDMSNVHFASGIPADPEERVVISLATGSGAGPAQYLGQSFRLTATVDTSALGWGDWAKWLLRRYEVTDAIGSEFGVWVRPQ